MANLWFRWPRGSVDSDVKWAMGRFTYPEGRVLPHRSLSLALDALQTLARNSFTVGIFFAKRLECVPACRRFLDDTTRQLPPTIR